MRKSRVIGIILFCGGTALIIGGLFASRFLCDSVRNFLGMGFTKEIHWYFIGGAVAVFTSLPLFDEWARSKSDI